MNTLNLDIPVKCASAQLLFRHMDVNVTIGKEAMLSHVGDYPDDVRPPFDSSAITFMAASSGSIKGGKIKANGAYQGIRVDQRVVPVLIEDVFVKDASHKQINIGGEAIVRNCQVECTLTGPNTQATGVKFDGDSKPIKKGEIDGLIYHSFAGSPYGHIKIAQIEEMLISRFTYAIVDLENDNSVVVGEGVGLVIITDSDLPRRIVHAPDDFPDRDKIAKLIIIENCELGASDKRQPYNHEKVQAEVVIYRKCEILVGTEGVIDEQTSDDRIRLRMFEECIFKNPSGEEIKVNPHGKNTYYRNCTADAGVVLN